MPAHRIDIFESIRAKVSIDETTQCWNWTASLHPHGYGQVSYNGRPRKAHRVSYEIHNGPIPKGRGYHGNCVLHRCDNPACVNPDHLFLGTPADNSADMVAKGRQPRVVRHGADNGQAKLSETQVREIRSIEGLSQRQIAKQFGISQSRISAIRNGKSWKPR